MWLNANRPSVNGAHASRLFGIPAVAERTAPNTADEVICASTSSSAGSVQTGAGLRYRLAVPSAAHHATPKPSALMVPPPRISRGAQACCRRLCSPPVTGSCTGTGVPT